ncbi:MAG: hypothetical protein MUC31_04855 [Bacteroidales bacterium]|nr:hypothetical protein [Bacteroidales bacterium]
MKNIWMVLSLTFILHGFATAQEHTQPPADYEDYTTVAMDPDQEYLVQMEEWQSMVEEWLENPVCINNEEAEWLMEYKIISLYQLNKLKEYWLIYGNLLSVFELSFIDGWDHQTVSNVIPLVTAEISKPARSFKKLSFRSFKHNLVLKTAVSSYKSKGYRPDDSDGEVDGNPVYTGSPFRFALRYDLEYRNKLSMGIRMEKDPGEPLFIPSQTINNIKSPDLFSGYLEIKRLGPVRSILAGNYRVNFGYGINLGGGQTSIRGRNGMTGMAHRIRQQTSTGESGFFRGIAIQAVKGPFSVTAFGSFQNHDVTSLTTDSLTGKPVSFSSLDLSGLHRTESELSSRKQVREKVIGGFFVFQNNWLKTGFIAMYNQFDANISKGVKPYAKFGLSGRHNLVTGLSGTVWFSKLQCFTELSVSRNHGVAFLSGLQVAPVPGTQFVIIYRKFGLTYQNWYGSGFISSGRNSDESGIQVRIRIEMPKKWMWEMMTDISRSAWVSYDLDAPSNRREIRIMAEKSWPQGKSVIFSFRYLQEKVDEAVNNLWICHPDDLSRYSLRLEGRFGAWTGIRLKSRMECSLASGLKPAWLIFQDIEYENERIKTKFWLRACVFDIPDYLNRIYAYENDVMYDYTSFMHYGKGIRGIAMIRSSLLAWLDLWLRFSTIYYTNKNIGTGWDELGSNRQNETEIQLRIKIPR